LGNGPTVLPTSQGNFVSVQGTGFDVGGSFAQTKVYFGGQLGTGTNCTNLGSTGTQQCQSTAPPGAGTVMITVVNSNGGSASSRPLTELQYTPAISSLSTTVGPAPGGTGVVINGSGLAITGGTTSVLFGTVAASNVSCSLTLCLATAPRNAGVVDVQVTVTNQIPGCVCWISSPAATTDRFAYVPVITSISAGHGLKTGGAAMTVTGDGLSAAGGATQLSFGNSFASSFSCTLTSCSVTSPATSSTGLVDIQATVAGQPSLKSTADQFFETLPMADVNGDGSISPLDAQCLLRAAANLPATQSCPSPLPHPDVNQDGQVNPLDAQCVLRYISALPPTFGCPVAP
ncbi:MAG: IPT/TIG domain-containing protein, partial [Dehalococcoidia bacterium]